MLTTEKTVREIAIENPETIRVFEALGIDYCCGGKKTLTAACSSADLDLQHVVGLIETAQDGSNNADLKAAETTGWNSRPLAELTTYIIENHHSFVRREIPRIESLLNKVVAKHGPNHPRLIQVQQLFMTMAQELSFHLLKEENILFPYIGRMDAALQNHTSLPAVPFGSVTRPIAAMVAEHDDAGHLLARIRETTNGFTAPDGVCPTFLALYRGLEEFERDLHRHIHLENNILFPRAVEIEERVAR